MRFALFLVAAFLVALLVVVAKKEKSQPPQKGDLKYITCEVCKHVVENLYAQYEDKASTSTSSSKKKGQPIDELSIAEILDGVCKPTLKGGEWIRALDITEVKGTGANSKYTYLQLEAPGGISKCGVECSTMSYSCEQLLEEEIDRDMLSSMLWKHDKTLEEATDLVCKKWTKRCSKEVSPKALTGKRTDESFIEVDEKALQMEQLMAQMNAAGLGGGMSMYSRDDMDSLADMYGGMGDEDDPYSHYGDMGMGGMGGMGGGNEEEDEEDVLASKSGFEF